MGSQPIDPVYLPFDRETLRGHFAQVRGEDEASQIRRLDYYLASAERAAELGGTPDPTPAQVRAGRQMEKDERFWVAASLMTLFHDQTNGGAAVLFAELMRQAGLATAKGGQPWEEALSGPLELYFEANLNSPTRYRSWLAQHRDRQALVPYARAAAAKAGLRVEGATKVDAILVAPETGSAVVFEAKVLSDLSTRVSFDATRNQLARIIDVVLDHSTSLRPPLNVRDPHCTYVVLITPELLSPRGPAGASRGRLYGWVLPEYQDPDSPLLAQHLPHRAGQLGGIHARLGWATWELIDRVRPGACSWLGADTSATSTPAYPSNPTPAG